MKFLIVLALCFAAVYAREHSEFIVGGSNVPTPGKYPWQASLQFRSTSSHTCGASLISSTYLVSAAHCVGSGASAYKVVVGLHDRTTRNQGSPTDRNVASITIHPAWDNSGSRGFPNDIAVLRISSVSYNQFISPATLPSSGQSFVGSSCFITGWGRLYGGGPLPNILQEARISVISQSECRGHYGSIIQGYHICLLDSGRRTGSCQGDSGGPLNCQVGGVWYMAGVTSFGVVGCPPSRPSVYASAPYFRSWIRQQTGV